MAERLETRLKLKRFLFHNLRSVRRFLGRNKTVYAEERVEEYRGYWEEGARTLGAEFVSLTDSLWEVRLNGRHTRIKLWMVQLGDPVVNRIAGDKVLCYQWATRLGVPVPQHLVFRLEQLPKAKEFLRENPGVYVVKPTSGTSSGVGISTHIRTPQQLENAAVTASLFADELLVERMIFGETCRLLWLGGELIHAVRRRGVRVWAETRPIYLVLTDERYRAGGTEAAKVGVGALEKAGVLYTGLQTLGGGAIIGGMILGAIGAFLIDRRFNAAAGYAVSAAILAFFGFVHGSKLGWAEAPQVALGYLLLAAVCYLIPRLGGQAKAVSGGTP